MSHRFLKSGLLMIVPLVLTSCASVKSTALRSGYSNNPPAMVEVFFDKSDVKRPFVEIAYINANNQEWSISEPELIEKMKKKAREMRADAIVIMGKDESSSTVGTFGSGSGYVGTFHRTKVGGIAIVYKRNYVAGTERAAENN